MQGHIWEEYASETYRGRPGDPNLTDPSGGGRGYYRNISLLNVWAHAPFMHNNAVGPELCGQPAIGPQDDVGLDIDLYRSPYVTGLGPDGTYQRVANPEASPETRCWPYDPGVEGRYKLFLASMEQLLNPGTRGRKISLLDDPIRLEFLPRTIGGVDIKGVNLIVPAGLAAGQLVSFQGKQLVLDLVTAKDPGRLREVLVQRYGPEKGAKAAALLVEVRENVLRDLVSAVRTAGAREASIIELEIDPRKAKPLLELYDTCTAEEENGGHTFGEDLAPDEKQALTAFLATL
jgi:hypothetical protein